jgi:hypothetical protein
MCIIFLNFFDILKFSFEIKGAYAHEIKSAFLLGRGLYYVWAGTYPRGHGP